MGSGRWVAASVVAAVVLGAGCTGLLPSVDRTNPPGPAADGVVHVDELPPDAREEVTSALERRQYRASDLAFLDAVNASRAFVVEHDGDRYWPSVENASDRQGRAYTLTMRLVYALDDLPADVRREVREGVAEGAYRNQSLAYLEWAEDGPRPVVESDGTYHRTCVWTDDDGTYTLWVEPLDSVRERDTEHC